MYSIRAIPHTTLNLLLIKLSSTQQSQKISLEINWKKNLHPRIKIEEFGCIPSKVTNALKKNFIKIPIRTVVMAKNILHKIICYNVISKLLRFSKNWSFGIACSL